MTLGRVLSAYVVRAFVELRALVNTNKELAGKVHALERKVSALTPLVMRPRAAK